MPEIRVTNTEELEAALGAATDEAAGPWSIRLTPGVYGPIEVSGRPMLLPPGCELIGGNARRGPRVWPPEVTVIANVRDFGAKGDQVADDASAIQAALDAIDPQ